MRKKCMSNGYFVELYGRMSIHKCNPILMKQIILVLESIMKS